MSIFISNFTYECAYAVNVKCYEFMKHKLQAIKMKIISIKGK